MCGIAGFCNLPHNWRENIERMNKRMLHRGPDEGGVWSSESCDVVLGHRRLSILDLTESGRQPMMSQSGRFVIVFNGEIYNFTELRDRLLSDSIVRIFRGHSDTEILLEHIESYGFDETLRLSKGMFAIALYDREEKKLLLARDRLGEKPLYYGKIGNGFIFASEIGVIREHEDFSDEIDREALSLYFRHGYIPAPFSIYKNIRKLDAGSVLELSYPFDEVSIHKYWDIRTVAKKGQTDPFPGTYEEAVDKLDNLLTESIKLQMVADVPVGAFLSGGIDSTTTVALMQKVSSVPVKTFSIGFGEEKFNEAVYAKESAKYLGTDHTELYVTDEDALGVIPEISHFYGEPFADSSQIPTYLVSKLARSKVTVSLSGDAGDELFCGYNTYYKVKKIWDKIHAIPMPLRSLTRVVSAPFDKFNKAHLIRHYITSKDPADFYLKMSTVIEDIDSIVLDTLIPPYKMSEYQLMGNNIDIRNDIMLMDLLVYHPDDILVKVDRSGMAVSLESRIPFLDRDVVEFALSLPIDYKMKDGVQKRVLKDVLYRYIPKDMMERPKKGFSMPVSDWCRTGKLREWMEDSLSDTRIRNEGILDPDIVSNIKNKFLKTGRYPESIWYLCIFEQWMKKANIV